MKIYTRNASQLGCIVLGQNVDWLFVISDLILSHRRFGLKLLSIEIEIEYDCVSVQGFGRTCTFCICS